MKRFFILGVALCCSFFVTAQIPAGYYDSAMWKEGEALHEALYNIIKNHTIIDYDNLWSKYPLTDRKPNGKVWDMYSDVPGGTPSYEFVYTSDQCGNYSQEGDCYNREHSFPKSWFNDASPMYSDLFHVYPTDGHVNGKRGNLPFGEVGSSSWVSTNGSKVGMSNYPGYSGQVFEPIDEYKGDFARTYFYMITRYKNVSSNWSSEMLSGGVFSDWALKMLYEWDRSDPISQKEIDRNNAVYNAQGNRNPFIDDHDYAFKIWDKLVGIEGVNLEKEEYSIVEGVLYLNSDSDILIYDIMGRELLSFQGINALDISSLNNGTYIFNLKYTSFKYIVCK